METLANFCRLVIFLSIFYCLEVNGQREDPVVVTKYGVVVGRYKYFDDTIAKRRSVVREFLGIPYAKPPLGNLRFKKPERPEPWGICKLKCHTMPNACTQFMPYPFPWALPTNEYTSEDCLYLNIWVPHDASLLNKKSVFFWVHGGGYFTGSNSQPIYQGHPLAAIGDVIVVVPNYRLGSFGFWTNNATEAPGNVAIWDLIAALKWVNENIESFGGDKHSVTIGGESAGGVLVSLLTITSHVSGLYKRQIIQSATAMSSFMDDPNANFVRSQQVSEKVGCANESYKLLDHPKEVAECMRGIDALTIIKEEGTISPGKPNSFFPMWGDELFPRLPRDLQLEGHFPFTDLFIGDSGHEGACLITTDNVDEFGFFGKKDPPFDREMAKQLILKYFSDVKPQKDLLEHYLNVSGDVDWRLQAADSYGDYLIECPNVFYAAVAGQTGTNTYYYDFEHRPSRSVWAKWMKTTHFDEVDFVFGGPIRDLFDYPMEEKLLSRMMITHWTNFVKTGKPTNDWPLYAKKSELRVYNGSGDPTPGFGPHEPNYKFWFSVLFPNSTVQLPTHD